MSEWEIPIGVGRQHAWKGKLPPLVPQNDTLR